MADKYIRKQDAINALQEKVFHNLTDEFYGAIQVLDELPSADFVQVVHGTWLPTVSNNDIYKCSECGKMMWFSPRLSVKSSDYIFCPNCGAKMDAQEEE